MTWQVWLLGAALCTVTGFADDGSDRAKIAGIWESQTGGAKDPGERAGESWILETKEGAVHVTQIDDGHKLAEFECNTLGRECEVKDSGHSAKVRASDIRVHVDQESRATIATDDLDRILLDIHRIAFSHSNVHRIDVYSGRRPGEACIRLAAEYAVQTAFPRVRITGQNDEFCAALTLSEWPDTCSATWFDNGFEFIYQVRIKHFLS